MRLQNVTTKCATLLLVGVLTGCSTTPTNPWAEIETPTEPATRPVDLPGFPKPISADRESVTFDLEGARRLRAFQEAAEGNTEIAAALADQVDELQNAAGHLVEAGEAQAELTRIQREIIAEERQRHLVEKGVLYLGVIALILAL